MKRRFGFRSPVECRPLTKVAVACDAFERRAAHACHEVHVEHHVGAVRDLNAAAGKRRVDRTHAVGHHIQGASLHAAGEQGVHLRVGLLRGHPMVVGTCIFLFCGANEGQMFHARHVRRMRAGQHAAREALRVERQQLLVCNQLALQRFELRVAAIAPMNLRRLRQLRDFIAPRPRRHDSSRRGLRAEVRWPLAIPRRKLDRFIRMTDGCGRANSSPRVGLLRQCSLPRGRSRRRGERRI